jgi:hypothetical protein
MIGSAAPAWPANVSSGSILSKKGSRGWRPLSARGKDSSNCSLSATAILQARQSGTRFYPLTTSSVIRATFSTVSVNYGPRNPDCARQLTLRYRKETLQRQKILPGANSVVSMCSNLAMVDPVNPGCAPSLRTFRNA